MQVAPIRQMIRKSEDKDPGKRYSTSGEVAEFTKVPSRHLLAWRRSRLLVVQHDRVGNLRDAANMDDRISPVPPHIQESAA